MVVVVAVVLAVGLCWCVWPRVDQRFVGTWRCTSIMLTQPERMDYRRPFELRSDGRTQSFFGQSESNGSSRQGRMKWRTDGGRFRLIPEDVTLEGMLESISFLFRYGSWRGACFDAEIVAVEQNLMIFPNDDGTYRFERVAE
ncbi:hypothetical protein AYO47_00135 [Planctomyces sp. SCGC AG-212-M04]|nr:hypothetical protein AYO47_00135 [Planctomyces sp. SCGC AG-212-M04]